MLGSFTTAAYTMENGQNTTEMLTTVTLYTLNTTDSSSVEMDSTQTNVTIHEQVVHDPALIDFWVYLGVRTLWGVLGLFGNSLTIFAVAKFDQLKTCTNYLLCSLAVADILSCVMVPLFIVHELYSSNPLFIPVCLVQQGMAILSSSGNGLSILYVSIDRYIYIAIPLRYHGIVTPQRTMIILTVSWIFGLICVPILVSTANHLQIGMPCRYHIFLNEWVLTLYMAPQMAVVILLIIWFNLAIARIAHKQARSIHAQSLPYATLEVAINQSTIKISRTLGLVLGVYVISTMPHLIMACITFNGEPHERIEKYLIALYWANTWFNPLIYAWRLKDFKIAFRKIFTGKGSFTEAPPQEPAA